MMGSSWARWRRSRRCWEHSGRPCPRWGWSSTCGKRRSGAWARCPRRLPSQPRHAFTWRRARRCWGYRSTPPSITRRWGPTPGNAEREVCPHMCNGCGPRRHPVRSRAHAVLPGSRKGTVRPPHLASPPHGGLHGGRYCDPAGHVGRGGGHASTPTSTSDAAWVQTTLPMSEGRCGVASAADVAPVARLAGVMQFLARADLMLGCDRQLVVPLATEAGLLDTLNAPLPRPSNNWQVGLGLVRWNCRTGMSDASTGGHPG